MLSILHVPITWCRKISSVNFIKDHIYLRTYLIRIRKNVFDRQAASKCNNIRFCQTFCRLLRLTVIGISIVEVGLCVSAIYLYFKISHFVIMCKWINIYILFPYYPIKGYYKLHLYKVEFLITMKERILDNGEIIQ